ncbi:ImmA/IrrE family metallo-endopeptidase [Caloranaerobacter sp. TR13]|uniref:ImmA/IrrE family metallo-endopeptidase n=1 Tax=Caloranaerobacter sp. TR13 TaxID=1302151 RepID=UPI0006D3FFC6|nr:ImmA/IrrE family metallo-endopeptidase [Caloranaerobacter sp. TR13]
MLSLKEIEKIEKQALEQRRIYDLGDESPIGLKIFSYIENIYDSYILLYPLKTRKIAGFTRKQGEIIQIFVNTSFSLSFQVFATAHELYHLIYLKEKSIDKFIVCNDQDISESIDDTGSNIEEIKANYFAAAFLMPRSVIEDRFSNFKRKKYLEEDLVLKITELQYEYEIPYKTILKRLKELGIIGKKEFEKLKSYDEQILEYCKMLDDEMCKRINELEHSNRRKYHSLNVPKIAYDVYRNNIITISKLESIIKKYDKTLEDFRVVKPEIKPIDIDFSSFRTGDDEDDEN